MNPGSARRKKVVLFICGFSVPEDGTEVGALVHQNCHLKGLEAVATAAKRFDHRKTNEKRYALFDSEKRKPRKAKDRKSNFPEGTEARAYYNGKWYYTKITSEQEWILLDNHGKSYAREKSPSGAAKKATGKNLNGWDFWEIKRLGENWMPLDNC